MDRFNQRQRFIITSIWFNCFWFSCVFASSLLQLSLLAIGILLFVSIKPDYKLALLGLVLGLISDFSLYQLGIHQFINEQFPAWLLLLWIGFSLYLGAIHKQLRSLNPLLLILGVSILTPISYAYGTTIGKIHWPLGIGITYVVMFCAWLVYGCCLFTFRYNISNIWYRSVMVISGTISILLWPNSIVANELDKTSNIEKDAAIPWTSWTKVGQAQLEVLFWDVYQSQLYTPSGQYKTEQPMALAITYQMDIDKDDLIEATDEQWQHLEFDKDLRLKWLAKLDTIWPDIKEGDNLTYVLKNNYGSFYFNNTFIGQIDDTQHAKAFVDIWLSEKTKYPKLRKKLIAANSN